jgi:hypothetical protein
MTFAEVLPLALVMVVGPQIVTAFFLATSVRWAANSAAFVGGAAIAMIGVVSVVYAAANVAGAGGTGGHSTAVRDALDGLVLALMLFLIVRVYRARRASEQPRWMGRLHDATPSFALKLGLALVGVFPTDIATSIAVGARLAREGAPWWQCLPFVLLTLLLLALPALAVVTTGKRAAVLLPRTRDWMNAHAWVINVAVLGFFAVLTIRSMAAGS